jgi:hypothetical protein
MRPIAHARQRQREWLLASGHRAGVWARAKARTRQRQFLRTNAGMLTLLVAVIVGAATAALPFLPSSFARGFVLGVAVAGGAGVIAVWTLQATGTAATMMGDLAEQWTASELRRLRHHGWRLVNHFALRRWDIDHVLVGAGGVLAVETKWTSTPWHLDPLEERIHRAAAQARSNAADLQAWADIKTSEITQVQAVVVLWGAGTHDLSPDLRVQHLDGTTVITGSALRAWVRQLTSDTSRRQLTSQQVQHIWQALDRQVRRRDHHDQFTPPISFTTLTIRTIATGTAALLAAITTAWLLSRPGGIAWRLPVSLALIAGPAPLRRLSPARYPVLGWQAGAGGSLLIIATAPLLVILN